MVLTTNNSFIFCRTGRIKLLKNDVAVKPDSNTPEIPYSYDNLNAYDKTCGTFGLDSFQLDHPECPEHFVCNVPEGNADLKQYSGCIDSMNCHMLSGMTTNVNAGSSTALFLHQMIPHHQNAVNMAKGLMKIDPPSCPDLTDPDETDDCALESILREIINTQNAQIQVMRGLLESKFPSYPTDDCKVEIHHEEEDHSGHNHGGKTSGVVTATANLAGLGAAGALFAVL